jgi:hypothetical protein
MNFMGKATNPQKWTIFGLFFLLCTYSFFLSFFGLDITDFGFSLSSYHFVFGNPPPIEYLYANWGTNIIGGVILKIFTNAISIKLAGAVTLWITYFFCYRTLINFVQPYYIICGLFFTTLLTYNINWIHYNHLTALFFTAATYFLIQGLMREKFWFLAVSGFFLSFNIFVRFPNIVGLGLGILIFLYYMKPFEGKKIVRGCVFFLSGMIPGIVFPIIIMIMLGQWNTYVDSLKDLFQLASGSGVSHTDYSGNSLLGLLISDHLLVLHALLFVVLTLASYLFIFVILDKGKTSEPFQKGVTFLYSLFIGGIALYYNNERTFIIYLVSILYFIMIVNTVIRSKQKEWRLLSLGALILLFITPLGSNNGIWNAIYGMYFAMPIMLQSLLNLFNKRLGNKLTYLIVVPFILYALPLSVGNIYRDNPDFFSLRATADTPKLKMIFSVPDRVQALDELSVGLKKYLKKEDTLLVYEEVPIVPYLTDKPSVIPNPWPMLYNPDIFKEKLAKVNLTSLPVVVRAKTRTATPEWNVKNLLRQSPKHEATRQQMKEFLHQHQYKVVWENNYFQILHPAKETVR